MRRALGGGPRQGGARARGGARPHARGGADGARGRAGGRRRAGDRPRRRRHDPARAQARHRARRCRCSASTSAGSRSWPRSTSTSCPDALDRIDRDEHWMEERAVMTVSGTCFPTTFSAFNDSALSRVPGNGPAALAVEVEGEVFARYTADALVIATPTGSTAYSFAAGGPIVSPRHRGLLVTPVAPHAAFDRAVLPAPGRGPARARARPLGAAAAGGRRAARGRAQRRATASSSRSATPRRGSCACSRRASTSARGASCSSRTPPSSPRSEPARAGAARPARARRTSCAAPSTRWPRSSPTRTSPSSRLLLLDGREAGQVDLADPRELAFAYMRRIADLIDAFRPRGERDRRRCTWAAARARCRATSRRRGRSRGRSCSSSTRAWSRSRASTSGCARRRGCG